MSSANTRLSAKGQVVIPKQLRDAHGWQPGTALIAEVTDEGVLLRLRDSARGEDARSLLGCTGYRGPRRSLSDMERAVVKGAANTGPVVCL
jgi:AbrB family looped-hinge helix DNA binding protein